MFSKVAYRIVKKGIYLQKNFFSRLDCFVLTRVLKSESPESHIIKKSPSGFFRFGQDLFLQPLCYAKLGFYVFGVGAGASF